MMILFTVFEFIRKPWEGRELEVEKIALQNQNNLFESISSFSIDDSKSKLPEDTNILAN